MNPDPPAPSDSNDPGTPHASPSPEGLLSRPLTARDRAFQRDLARTVRRLRSSTLPESTVARDLADRLANPEVGQCIPNSGQPRHSRLYRPSSPTRALLRRVTRPVAGTSPPCWPVGYVILASRNSIPLPPPASLPERILRFVLASAIGVLEGILAPLEVLRCHHRWLIREGSNGSLPPGSTRPPHTARSSRNPEPNPPCGKTDPAAQPPRPDQDHSDTALPSPDCTIL